MPVSRWSSSCNAYGVGVKQEKYKQILLALGSSGAKLVDITFSPRTLVEENIYFTVEGTQQEVWQFYVNCPK